jgi:uncharacterized membrane protein YphA (DoxX/SURF4 family)
MNLIKSFWRREPVLFVASVIAIIDAGIGVAVAFGLQLNAVEVGAIGTLELAIGTFVQRSQVSPTTN